MNIAIIGAGNMGPALAASGLRAGHSVVLTATEPARAREAAELVGASAAATNAEAVGPADVVILAVPADAVAAIADDLGQELDGKIVIDVTNRMNLMTRAQCWTAPRRRRRCSPASRRPGSWRR